MAGSAVVSDPGRPFQAPWLMILLAISLAFNIALGGLAVRSLTTKTAADSSTASTAVNAGKWYSVFLNNKEAFVGHITDMRTDVISMQNIYYLTFEADASIANPKASDFQPRLKKLGNEVWGPQDFVRINRANMEYYTELRPDSPIVKAIAAYQTPSTPATPAPAPKPSPSK